MGYLFLDIYLQAMSACILHGIRSCKPKHTWQTLTTHYYITPQIIYRYICNTKHIAHPWGWIRGIFCYYNFHQYFASVIALVYKCSCLLDLFIIVMYGTGTNWSHFNILSSSWSVCIAMYKLPYSWIHVYLQLHCQGGMLDFPILRWYYFL